MPEVENRTYIPQDDYSKRDWKPFGPRKENFCVACKRYYKELYDAGLTTKPFMPTCEGDIRELLPPRNTIPDDELDQYDMAQMYNDPITWAKVMFGWDARHYQIEMACCSSQFKLARAGRRVGKALDVNTPIPTPDGWTTMRDIREGDRVFDEGGKSCNVTFVTNVQYNRKCYKIKFSDGSHIIADEDHQWTVDTKLSRKARGRSDIPKRLPVTLTTKDMLDDLYVWDGNKLEVNYSVEVAGPVQYAEKDLPIPPYVLGIWLGDGSSGAGTIFSADYPIIDEIKRLGYSAKRSESESKNCGAASAYRIKGLTSQLTKLEVCKTRKFNDRVKHIPRMYLESSISQREELLMGLMDSDGYCGKNGIIEFCSIKKGLALNVFELCLSLGYRPTIRESDAKIYGRVVSKRYRIVFCPNRPIFKLKRKLCRQKLKKAVSVRNRCRYIINITSVESVPVKCISVDSPNSLYLAGDHFIPTHNTTTIALLALHAVYTNSLYTVLVIAPFQAQVAKIFEEIKKFLAVSPVVNASVERLVNSAPMYLELKNGSFIRGFASGSAGGGNANQIRGQDAHMICLDEVDILNASDLEHIIAIKASHPDVKVWGSSTPTGARTAFYRWATQKDLGFKEFHYISAESPNYTEETDYFFRSIMSDMRFKQEILAEFGEESAGVFQQKFVDSALYDYALDSCIPNRNSKYVMGVDWNAHTGVHITIVEWNGEKLKLVKKKVVPRQEFTQLEGVRAIVELDRVWKCDWIYIDSGFGDTQYELLRRTGKDFPATKLDRKVVPIVMASHIKIKDAISGAEVKRQSKQFMVEIAVAQMEEGRCMFPKSEDSHVMIEPDSVDAPDVGIVQQMRGFKVEKYSSTGNPVYSQGYEHTLTAWMLSVVGFMLKMGGLTTISYITTVHTDKDFGKDKLTREKKETARPLGQRGTEPLKRTANMGGMRSILGSGYAHIVNAARDRRDLVNGRRGKKTTPIRRGTRGRRTW